MKERVFASPSLKHGKLMGEVEAIEEIVRQMRRYQYAASRPGCPSRPTLNDWNA